MRTLNPIAVLLFFLLFAAGAKADSPLVVIVNPAAGVDLLTKAEITNIFLARFKKLPSGLRAVPIDVTSHKESFYLDLVGKTPAEINAYWARLTFSGRTTPPRQETQADAVNLVASTPGAIAYVDRRSVDKRVKIVFEFEP